MHPFPSHLRRIEAERQHREREMRSFRLLFILVIVGCLVGMFLCASKARGAGPLPLPLPPPSKTCTAIYAVEPVLPNGVKGAWGQTSKFWPQNTTLRVRFVTGTARQKAEAWKRFQAVDALVNLSFVEVTGASDIRVRFDRLKGHWSYVGTDCRKQPASAPTMNLELSAAVIGGDFADEWDRVAIHEICHAIGLEHEHQSPLATQLVWNKPAVYAYYARAQGWDQRQVDFQVLNRSRATNILTSGWEPRSIMEYPIPAGLANVIIGWNERLTDRDKALLQQIYPPAK